ncbi:MAG: aldehyde dehydrogenase family protein [Pseudomonadota bacterium]
MTDITDNQFHETFAKLRAKAPELARTTAAERIEKLRRLYQTVYDLRHDISHVGKDELGMDGKMHLVPLKPELEYICANLENWMAREPVEDVLALQGRKGYVHYEPKGVCLHIATWNSPVLISISPVLSMIAAGNAVVIKPSEITPQSADLVVKIFEEAGLSDEVAVITGGAETAQELLKLPFNHICYVGNNRVGKLIMEAAAQHFAGVTLEMGGKNPAVVAADADIEDAAAKLAFSKMLIAGQVCLSPDYVLVHASVKDAFVSALTEKVEAFFNPTGAGADKSADMARIVNERHTARIKGLIDDAVAKGARIVHGGEINESDRYVSPTIIDGVTDDMEIAFEEIFGPVILIQSFGDREEAAAEIAKRPKPLAAYFFTQDRETADWYLNNTRAGTSAINNAVVQANVQSLPFGGCNHSGIGRLGGHAGFKEFSNGRAVVEDALNPKEGAPMQYPPFPPEAIMFVDMMLQP